MSAPTMSSRLDRLLMLLSSGSTPTTRAMASQQLASVVRAQPEDAHHILARLHPLLRHEQWEVRTAAVNAVAAVLGVMRDFDLKAEPDDNQMPVKQEATADSKTLLRFESFDLQDALDRASEAFDEPLAGQESPSGSQVEDKNHDAVDRQRKEMAKTLGLDITGGSTEELFTNEDLKEQKPDVSLLSARERNRLKRVHAKKNSLDEVKKKRKKEEWLYQAPDEMLDPNTWALDAFCNCLLADLSHSAWEVRHGASSALRELVRLHGARGGVGPSMSAEEAAAAHRAWMCDLALRVVSVMAGDRFGDFISDQVLAPVRESSAQALGVLLKIMPEEDVTKTMHILLECLKQEDWQCRHGALLGIKYVLVAREDLDKAQLSEVIPAVVSALEDQEDDVVSVAASAIVPLFRRADCLTFFDTTSFERHLWEYIKCVDELASSTPSILLLLSEFIQLQKSQSASDEMPGPSPVEKVTWLSKFLSHSSSKVRKTSLSTLETILDAGFLGELGSPNLSRLCSELFQRSLLEHKEDCLRLVEKVWNSVCDESPLNELLFATCLSYGNWLSMLVLPPAWPLPPPLILTSRSVSEHQFLGGAEAQHETNPVEKERRTTRARLLAIRLLGKLAAFIVRPGQGIDYSSQNLPPVEMFVQKILLPNLNTRSAYQRTTTCLVISEWCRQHPESKAVVPEYLKTALSGLLTEQIHYDEVLHAHVSIQSDYRDFIATLKHYKVPVGDLADKVTILNEISDFLSQLDLGSLLNSSKIKPNLANTLLERRNGILSALQQASRDQSALSIMTLASVAGALVSLDFLPDKLNPIIRPLMDSVKTERSELLQNLAAEKLAGLLEMCAEQRLMAPVEKTLKNLVVFACADLSVTPALVASPDHEENRKILALKFKEIRALQASGSRSKARPKRNIKAVSSNEEDVENYLDSESVTDVSPSESVRIQSRGSNRALATIVAYFGADLFQTLPVWYNLTIDAMLSYGTEKSAQSSDLVMYLRALEISVPVLSPALDSHLVDILVNLFQMLESDFSSVRHLASRCASEIAIRKPGDVMSKLVGLLLPQMESTSVSSRQGAVECVACIVERLDARIVPYITLLVIPVLGRMSDSDGDVRLLATNVFATLVRLAPLEGAAHEPSDLPKELVEKRARESGFLGQLLNVKNLEEYRLPVSIDAELRPYQTEGVKWLSFLNKYKLHGILCDDMGLGKTLQTICILLGDHCKLQSSRQSLPSLVICPATLCNHWYFETLRFAGDANVLSPIVYSGPVALRADLRRRLSRHNLVITSYEVIRNDIEHFGDSFWNYLVLDEGHLIKNAKAKTTLAIKSLKAQHRLILSGTPIQNSVLDLWSLFDFLMPGFLGSEKEFGVKYGKPIVSSRDPRSSSKDQEAGALALEALHKQVLPFILRRMKEDVLSDLPPKIVQDFHCELSPLQVQLYEDFSQSQLESARAKSAGETGSVDGGSAGAGMRHIFQALQYLRKVCNHPKLVLSESHPQISKARELLSSSHTSLADIGHAAKLPALRDLLLQCGIGGGGANSQDLEGDLVVQHRALVYFQFKAMMDIVENDLLKAVMPEVTYLRLDGSVSANSRQAIVDRFNKDASIDLLLLSTSIGGLGLNLTGADTVIFVEHDWNPMKDLQAMDRAHRIGQKKVVNVYRLITRNTIEEKIMGLQKFKLHTASSVITCENSSLSTMATDQILDLFSLDAKRQAKEDGSQDGGKGLKAMLENLPELWSDEHYEQEYDLEAYIKKV